MDYTFLLSKNDNICYNILTRFTQQPDQTLNKEELTQSLSLTTYQINKYFESMNADLALISKGEPCYLDEPNRGQWQAFGLNSFKLQKVALLYLNRSPLFTALEYQFFYANLYTKKEYVAANFMSSSVFYRSLDALEDILKDHHFYQASSLYASREFTIRLHLFQLYYTMYNSVSDPFEPLNPLVADMISAIQSQLPDHLNPTQETKLSTFLRVWLLRMLNKHPVEKGQLQIKPTAASQSMMAQLQDLLADQLKLDQTEFDYLYSFLVAQGFLGFDKMREMARNIPAVNELTEQFMAEIKNSNVLLTTHFINDSSLKESLLSIHFQFTTFYIEPTTFIDPGQVDFFADLYPAFDVAVSHNITKIQQRKDVRLTQKMAINLYFSYMFALINSIPPALMRDQVHICVDFSQGVLYTNYVIGSLDAFNHAHLIIDRHLTPDTDIYISDFHSPKVKQTQVIWQDPPTPVDWSNLADLILDTKRSKLPQLFPDQDVSTKGSDTNEPQQNRQK
ncbi:hypothetical protein [Secundilactobacillus folii]|uniref:Mga helix-turn-helix domain-containing protein n=1 Tax=Secundilactobacillus folii TaxID=2678357 RepID=A0A7X2XVE1_9LACO|nr:hypothetical protein [Secundilactobacillus folii]MTV81643.1 hypothetical protein [Secundilactobacillus folii]